MATYSLSGPAGTLVVSGKGLNLDMVEALKEGTVEWSTSAVSEVKLSLEDRRRAILNSGMVDPGTADGKRPGSPLSVGGHAFEVRALEHAADGTLVVQARSALVSKMRRARGVQVTAGPITAAQWVSRAVTKAGGKLIGQGCPTRQQITRQADESDWDVVVRLAREEGFLAFEVDGTVYFARPTWLASRTGVPALRVKIVNDDNGIARPEDPRILTRPAPRRSSDASEVCEWSVEVVAELAELYTVGSPAKLFDYPPFTGTYIIDQISLPLDDNGVATISATTPIDPEKQAQGGDPTTPTASATGGTTVVTPRAGKYGGVSLSAEQLALAAGIIRVGLAKSIPTKGLVIAIATAMQESTLRNLTYGDRDSIGPFQQRPSQGWGTRAQIMDPKYSATKFYDALLKVSGWQNMAVTVAAQKVQRSAFPNAYARWEAMARAVVAAAVRVETSRAASSVSGILDPRAAKAIAFARAQLGKPYIFGGTGPRGYDCSGLTQAAWRAAGVEITRTTYTQLANPSLRRISRTQLQPGDLVYPHSGHVMLYIGGGRVIEARKTGTPVMESALWGIRSGSQFRRVP